MTDGLDARFRLPRNAVPTAYRLRLEPDLDAATFGGRVEIDVELGEASVTIQLNALDLTITTASAVRSDGTEVGAAVTLDAELERATLRFDKALPAGIATLRLAFAGILNDRLVGFYRTTFLDGDGNEQVMATTQLALTDARRSFPCFDEPAFKATFALTAVVPAGLGAYSNSPARTETALAHGRREVAFAPTMKMSTYLVALVVGPLARGRVVDVDGVPLSVVSAPGKVALGEFALEVGAHALRFFTDYFGVGYPGEKVDLVGIPDFAYGAMENLGCITFRETLLLVDPATSSQSELQEVAMVVAHELAHMWFGDLVTMQWWEGIWLNEAFATFLQVLCIDAFRPEWKMWERFNELKEAGLEVDGLHATRPIEFAVHSPADAQAMIDVITYRKGGAVLRMLEQYLGPTTYRDGIRRYLRDHAYANTVTSDLWAALESASGEPVGEIMSSWIYQGGHPTVRQHGPTVVQAPFSFGAADGPSAIGTSWLVPLRTKSLHDAAVASRLVRAGSLDLDTEATLLLNAGGVGVYRSCYEGAAFADLAEGFGSLTELERAVVLCDTWALVRAGTQGLGDFFVLAGRLGTLAEPSSWTAVENVFDFLDRAATAEQRPALRARARELVGPVLAELGWEPIAGESEQAPLVRAIAVRILGAIAEDPDVRREAVRRFDAGAVDGDLASAIVAVVASLGREGDLHEMRVRIAAATDPQAQERYRTGIAALANERLALRTLESCFEWFRIQDAPFVVMRLLDNRTAGAVVFEQLAATWDAVLERVPEQLQSLLAEGVAGLVGDRALASRAAAFLRAHPLATNQAMVERAVERMLHGAAFAERLRPDLLAVLG